MQKGGDMLSGPVILWVVKLAFEERSAKLKQVQMSSENLGDSHSG